MGVESGISTTEFPRQSEHLHAVVRVCFNYDTSILLHGVVVRDDMVAPWRTIIRLDDGRYVLGTECQWSPYHD